MTVKNSLRHQCNRPTPTRAAPFDLHRQTGDVKTVRVRKLVEICQLLDLTILLGNPGEMRGPNVPAIARPLEVGDLSRKLPVQRPRINADRVNALADQP